MLQPGDHLLVTDALGDERAKRALTGVVEGRAFPVVWACDEQEWEAADAEGREPEPDPFPWPARTVRLAG